MITQITASTKDEYTRLFAEATEFLNREDVAVNNDTWTKGSSKINSLASYYFQLQNILLKENAEKGIEKFLVLPLDEPIFEINANNRAINIPIEFRQNGIGALGDKGAEILYFSINRYFDAMDFGSSDIQIYVQWENANGEKGIAGIFNKDISSDPNHIYFGWEINDAITKSAGAIKFSIRILVLDSDLKTIIYNFNTLTATVGVNSTLHYDFDYSSVEKSADVTSRIKNRIVKSPGVTSYKLTPPTFIEPKEDITIDLVKQSEDVYSIDLTALAASIEDETVVSESVQYFWFQVNEKGEKTSDLFNATNDNYIVSVTPTKDTKPIQGLTYYPDAACKEDPIDYDVEWPLKTDGSEELKYTILYIKKGAYEVKAAGRYGVQACTKDGTEISEPAVCQYYWTVPTANELIIGKDNISYDTAEKVILAFDESTQQYKAALSSSLDNVDDYHYISYDWKKDGNSIETAKTESNVDYNIDCSIDNRTQGQGKYELHIIGTKNNDLTEKKVQYFNVTLPVPKPYSTTAADLNSNTILLSQGETAVATVNYGSETYQEQSNIADLFSTSYEWFKIYNVTTQELNSLRDLAEAGNLTKEYYSEQSKDWSFVSIKGDSSLDGANKFVTDSSTPSNIFCVMTAHFNGQTAQVSTPVFNVVSNLI